MVYLLKANNFYKIGITKRKITKRFEKKSEMPYKWEEIKVIPTNLYDAIFLEKKLHKKHKEFRYFPKQHFAGFTECFTKLIQQKEKK